MGRPLTCALCPAVCSIRVIGESDIMQEFLSESDEVGMWAVCCSSAVVETAPGSRGTAKAM